MADGRTWAGVILGAGALLWALRGRASASPRAVASEDPPRSAREAAIDVDEKDPAILRWRPIVEEVMPAQKIPVEFAMAWLAVESGGRPCAVGERTATGPDGYPREVGLFQIYNPDDFKAIGASPSELVTYCERPAVGPKQKEDKDGGFRDGTLKNSQQVSRALTSEEDRHHIELGAKLLAHKRRQADKVLMASGTTWSTTSPDYWSMVKMMHAYPAIGRSGLPAVKKKLGRAPRSWREFRTTYEQIEPRARFNAATDKQSVYYRALRNAEWVGFHVQSRGVS